MDPALAGGLLAAGALAHLAAAWVRARPSGEPVPARAAFQQRWQALHGGYDPSANFWVRGWLTVVHAMARPLAGRGVAPDAVTWFALWPVAGMLVAAHAGGRWALLAAALVALSAVIDALDGAVAALTARHSRWGYLLDSLIDRVADLGYVTAVVLLGAPLWLGAAVGAVILLHEYARARGGNAGAGEVGAVTVAERPTRAIVGVLTLVVAGAAPEHAALAAGAGLAVLGALGLVGLVHLLAVLRGALAGPGDRGAG